MATEYTLPFTGEEIEEKLERVDLLSEEIVNQQEQIDNLPNNETLIESVAEKVPYVKVAEKPTCVNSIAEMTNKNQMYVLNSDGMFYAYMQKEITTEGSKTPNFTNVMDNPNAYIKDGYRYSHSSQAFKEQATDCSIVIPIPSGTPVIRVRGAGNNATYNTYVYKGNTNSAFTMNVPHTRIVEDNGDITITVTTAQSTGGYATFAVASGVKESELIVTVNEEITYTIVEGGTQIIEEWSSTGISYNQPADYESRVIEVETDVENLENKTAELGNRILELEEKEQSSGGESNNIIPLGLEWLNGYRIPRLILSGDTSSMTKDNDVSLEYECVDKDNVTHKGTCTMKWQGSSSIQYEKKNYTIKLDNAIEVVDGWGSQKKYCLKANYIDHSHARNVVSAKLWGQVVKSRENANATLNALVNGGAIDGFPIIIILNGEFHGLYTWNIPKDGWMFGMNGGTTPQAIVCADGYHDSTLFKGFTTLTDKVDFSFEYSNDDETEWVKTSLNQMLQKVIDSNGTDLDSTISQYIDLDSLIDYVIFAVLIRHNDGVWKNYILSTYDGTKWFFSAYDMDSTYGLSSSGLYFQSIDADPSFEYWTQNRLFNLLWTHKREKVRARYNQLRSSVLSEANVTKAFWDFGVNIPKAILDKDVEKWTSIPSSYVNDISQILHQYRLRCMFVDEWINK